MGWAIPLQEFGQPGAALEDHGTPGEHRYCAWSCCAAVVGLLGLPNAGKSTFIRAVSELVPRCRLPLFHAGPQSGVVRLKSEESFVVADIPV
jgi:GTP-binding protein